MVVVVLEQPKFQTLLEVEEASQALEEGVAFLAVLEVEAEEGAYQEHRVAEVVEGASHLPDQVEVEVVGVLACPAREGEVVEGACLLGQAEVVVEGACLPGQAEVEVVVACLLGQVEVGGSTRLALMGQDGQLVSWVH